MKIKFKAIAGIAIVASTLLLHSCSSDPDSSGVEYMPDMYRSPAIEPYVDYGEIRGRENKELKTKLTAMTPPHYTIPFFGTNKESVLLMLPYHRLPNIAFKTTHGLTGFDFTTEDSYLAAVADVTNPLNLTDENSEEMFSKGKEIFTSKCMHCHGEKGDGNGQMMINGTYAGVPSYADRLELSNGQIFYSIYYGKGAMGAHNSLITKRQIWTLVHYVRRLQNVEYGKNLSGPITELTALVDKKDSTNLGGTIK
jgi:mono/diheme cytochrome c family protein